MAITSFSRTLVERTASAADIGRPPTSSKLAFLRRSMRLERARWFRMLASSRTLQDGRVLWLVEPEGPAALWYRFVATRLRIEELPVALTFPAPRRTAEIVR